MLIRFHTIPACYGQTDRRTDRQNCYINIALYQYYSPPISRYISEMVEDRWVHAARRLTSIEFSFDPCNIYRDCPRGEGYPADARSVGDSHPSCNYPCNCIVLKYCIDVSTCCPMRTVLTRISAPESMSTTNLQSNGKCTSS